MSEVDFQTNDFPESEGVEEVAEQETTPPLITMEDADSTTFVSEQDTSPKTEELVSFDETPSSTVEDIPASNEGMMDGFEILPPTEPAAAAPADTSDSVPDVKQTVVEEEEPAVVTNGTTATEHSEPQSRCFYFHLIYCLHFSYSLTKLFMLHPASSENVCRLYSVLELAW